MTKKQAQEKAKQRRKRGNVLARASPDPDARGYYGVYIAPKKK